MGFRRGCLCLCCRWCLGIELWLVYWAAPEWVAFLALMRFERDLCRNVCAARLSVCGESSPHRTV